LCNEQSISLMKNILM